MEREIYLQASLLSHTDKKIYCVNELVELAMKCYKEGACMIHYHAYKVGGIDRFMEVARLLEELNGPKLNIAASDYNSIMDYNGKLPRNIVCAAMHGGDCSVFGTKINKSFSQAEDDMKTYLDSGIIPEVCVFNSDGIDNCVKLNQKYPDKFFVGVYLNYPNEMKATKTTIMDVSKRLVDCKFCSYIIYNNKNEDLYKYVLQYGGHLRSGMEDNNYCGKRLAKNSVDHIVYLSRLIRSVGMVPTASFLDAWKRPSNI